MRKPSPISSLIVDCLLRGGNVESQKDGRQILVNTSGLPYAVLPAYIKEGEMPNVTR